MSYVDKIKFNGTEHDVQDSYAARSVEGDTSSHVLEANEIYTETSQSQFAQFTYRTAGGTASISSGDAILVTAYGLCYQPAGDSTEEALEITGTFSDGDTTVAITSATWNSQVTDDGTYEFSYDGSDWSLDGSTVDLADYGITVTGTVTSGDTITVTFTAAVFNTIYVATPTSFVATGFNQYNATAGYAHVVGGNQYRIDGTYTSLGFTTTVGGTTTEVTVTDSKFTPEEDGYIYVNGASGDILIALVWSGTMNDEGYVAYEESTITVPTEDADGTALPTASYGLPGIGSVDDSINFEEGIYTQRIGRYAYSVENLATVKALGVDYIFDDTNIFYVLASEVTYTLDDQAYTYTVNDYGIEEWVGTVVPIYTGLRYGNSLVDKLRTLADIQSVSSDLEIDDSTLKLSGSGAGLAASQYGGRNLADVFGVTTTAEIVEALSDDIANDFEKARVGDYFTVSVQVGSNTARNIDMVLAHPNYFKNTGDPTVCATDHWVVVPDTAFYELARMESSNTTENGYYGSLMHGICSATYTTTGSITAVKSGYEEFIQSDLGDSTSTTSTTFTFTYSSSSSSWQYDGSNVSLSDYGLTVTGTPADGDTIVVTFQQGNLEAYRQAIYDAFGEHHVLNHREYTSISTSEGDWYTARVELMSESMVYGRPIRANSSARDWFGPSQLALFRNEPNRRVALRGKNGSRYVAWLSSSSSGSNFCIVGSNGLASNGGASSSAAVRPFFLFA